MIDVSCPLIRQPIRWYLHVGLYFSWVLPGAIWFCLLINHLATLLLFSMSSCNSRLPQKRLLIILQILPHTLLYVWEDSLRAHRVVLSMMDDLRCPISKSLRCESRPSHLWWSITVVFSFSLDVANHVFEVLLIWVCIFGVWKVYYSLWSSCLWNLGKIRLCKIGIYWYF